MNRLGLLATVASLALTGAAFAQTSNSTTPPATPKPAATSTAPATTPAPRSSAMKPAQAPATTAAQPATQPEQKTVAAPAKPAEPKAAMAKNPRMKPAKAAHATHEPRTMRSAERARARHHAAMHATMATDRLADRETKALNVLEAKGYGSSYENFQRDGKNYSAMVMKNGKPEKVIVNPDTGAITPQR
jgi:type IV secretory pathway VirB10-like protein